MYWYNYLFKKFSFLKWFTFTDDDSVIPNDLDKSDEIDTVFANMADFYFGAVSIGKCDLRLLLKIGDKG